MNLLRVMYRDPQGLEVAFSNILNIKQNFKRFTTLTNLPLQSESILKKIRKIIVHRSGDHRIAFIS